MQLIRYVQMKIAADDVLLFRWCYPCKYQGADKSTRSHFDYVLLYLYVLFKSAHTNLHPIVSKQKPHQLLHLTLSCPLRLGKDVLQ